MGNWVWLRDDTYHWKGHVVPADLVAPLVKELAWRSAGVDPAPVFTEEPQVTEAFFDLPGMVLAERATRRIDVEGLSLEVPSQDWESVLYQVRLLRPRAFAGTAYYKLHGWRYCVILTPAHRETVLAAMEAQRAEAAAEGEADDQRFAAGIQQINEEAGHVVVVSPKADAINKPKQGAN